MTININRSLIELCARLEISFVYPEFLIIDASDAEYNAAKSVFGDDCDILMCWFHVMKNIKKPETRRLITVERYEEVRL